MFIKKVSHIKDFGSFIDFVSGTSLPDFKRYNVIYGWNRSGKTTFSRVLRCFETNESFKDCPNGEFEFEVGDEVVNNKDLNTGLKIRVFNKDFVDDNISWEGDLNTNPIFYLGEDNIELNKKIKKLQEENEKNDAAKRKASHELQDLLDKHDRSLSSEAHEIKTTLTTSTPDKYRNYDKRDLETLLNDNFSEVLLQEKQFLELKQQISQESMGRLSLVSEPHFKVSASLKTINDVLSKSIVTQSIGRLKNDPELNTWVRSGLFIHKHKGRSTCQFCGQELPDGHLQTLEKHFSDEYENTLNQIRSMRVLVNNAEIEVELHDQARLYKEFQGSYSKKIEELRANTNSHNEAIKKLLANLEEKEVNVFKQITKLSTNADIKNLEQKIANSIKEVNDVIAQHNKKSESFDKSIEKQKQTLEFYFATRFKKTYEESKKSIWAKKDEQSNLSDSVENVNKEIAQFQQELISSHIPVKKINENLVKFFGHDEIQIKVKDSGEGYHITRNGEFANNLSESEKTTIALIYFLIKLRERDFSLSDGVVVIDDPVSSMDSGYVFQAFGFIKTHVKDASQVFILTHNFEFFRQVKNWFEHLRNSAQYLMLECNLVGNRRKSTLKPLDKLLLNFESEYHYLFSLIYRYVNETETSLEKAYPYPNIARKFLESFLAFKIPTTDSLHAKLGKLSNITEEDRTKVLRFVDTHSHLNSVNGIQDIDMNLLSEADSAMNTLLEFVKEVDGDHYRYLEESINSS